MVAFIQKAHGCIFLYDAIEAQADHAAAVALCLAVALLSPPSCRRPRAVTLPPPPPSPRRCPQ